MTVDLPYPRLQTDHEVVTMQADILELFELMEGETARRRANGSFAGTSGPG